MTNKHTELQEVTRNADEIQTTFIGFLLDGRVIEIGDINHKPNRENTRRIVNAFNYHHRLREALDRLVRSCDNLEYEAGMVALPASDAEDLLTELDNLEKGL